MKIRKHRLSLALGILSLVLGGGFSLLLLFGKDIFTSFPQWFEDFLGEASRQAGIGRGELSLLPLSAFVFVIGLVFLIFRKRKRFSMFLSIPFLVVIYLTVMLFSHMRDGNSAPSFLMTYLDSERSWLVLLCAILEVLLLVILLTVSGKVDKNIADKEEKRIRRLILETEQKKEKESENEDSEPEKAEEAERSLKEEKEDKKYMRMKARMDKKTEKKEARLAAKDEKKFKKYQEKEEKRAQKEQEKQDRAALKAEKKSKAEVEDASTSSEDVFLTKGAKSSYSVPDPSIPVDIPSVSELPHMKKIKTPDEITTSSVTQEEKEPYEMPPVSDVFSQLKGELEREDVETGKETEKQHELPSSFQKGGMLEATLEAMAEMNGKDKESDVKSNTAPIIGVEDKKKKKAMKSDSFAPSGLSPDHPRYKLFEALSQQKNVSSFPSKTFHADETVESEEPSFHSPAVKATEHAEKKIPGLSGFMKIEEEKAEDDDVAVDEVPLPQTPPAAAAPAEDEGPDPFEEIQRREAASKAKRQAAMKQEMAEEADDNSSEDADSEIAAQQNELLLSVGIGGLQSNELGYAAISRRAKKKYTAPPANILVEYPKSSSEIDDFTRRQSEIIIETFNDFHVNVTLDDIIKGPTVTMYQLKLGEGVMVQKVKQREDELSYNLGGVRIRILAPVPGRQAVGIEVPNKHRAIIGFKDMLQEFKKREDSDKLRVPMILGRTITGEPVTIDVAKMPHMLIAGTTGSGKSVCINSFICTLIYTRSPQDVRLIMVDPKVVELTVYNNIPHLLTPVITEPKKVVKALAWLCDEMERRYQMISKFGVRNIEGLNSKIRNENIPAEKMPYIVLIMDEFADLMTTVGKDIENYVARLAAKARAAGIHLILATQRPSADVITGTIKNNFPARIAFAVSSATNSRIILDEGGAENLLGRGDMLLMEPSTMGFQRIQGAFLSDDEVYSIVDFAQKHGTPDYLAEDIFEEPEVSQESDEGEPVSEEDSDEVLYERAKQIVFERKCASASFLQRRMKIGYNRAARLIEMMEENGIIGPQNGSKPREILKYE